jgi:hypothetical protein
MSGRFPHPGDGGPSGRAVPPVRHAWRRLPPLLLLALAPAIVAGVLAAGSGGRGPPSGDGGRGPPSGDRVVARPRGAGAVAVRLGSGALPVTLGSGAVPVPRSYLGLSTEYWAMPVFEQHMGQFERILAMVRGSGNGPLALRIGGDSTDHALFDVNVTRTPHGIFDLSPTWFRQVSSVVDTVGARELLDLNLVTDLPEMAALWARAAQEQLPQGSISGYEIGNEPDLYNPSYWSRVFGPIADVLGIRLLESRLTPAAYIQLYRSYAAVLARYAPGVPLVAPVVAYPTTDLGWIATLLQSPHPSLGLVSAHMYPYSACVPRLSPDYPSIGKILSEAATAGMAGSLRSAITLTHAAGLPFRLTELNSVTCGGVAGISNTFATALWAPDALFELLRAGVNGVNVHVRAFAINAAFAPVKRHLVARPLLYGLLLFVRALGPDAQLVQLRVPSPHPPGLKIWGVRILGGTVHVLVINKTARPARVDLRLPLAGPVSVERLRGPTAAARSGVTLAGQRLGVEDRWVGRRVIDAVPRVDGGYPVVVPAVSAALVTGRLA